MAATGCSEAPGSFGINRTTGRTVGGKDSPTSNRYRWCPMNLTVMMRARRTIGEGLHHQCVAFARPPTAYADPTHLDRFPRANLGLLYTCRAVSLHFMPLLSHRQAFPQLILSEFSPRPMSMCVCAAMPNTMAQQHKRGCNKIVIVPNSGSTSRNTR